MNKIYLTLSLFFLFRCLLTAQPATDFTAADCTGTPHNLFTELNTGKVVVLNWVMPCTTCIPASVSAFNIVQSFATSNPGQVVHYLIDDDGGQSCATLINWANTNSIEPHAVFQNSGNVISEANYGGSGMPHIVVVGPDHNIYFNGLDAAANDPAGVTNAINQALLVSGILQAAGSMFHLSVAVESKTASINFSLGESSIVNIEMLNEAGQLVATKALGKMPAGNNNAAFELDGIAAGVYFIRLKTENSSQTVKFSAVK